MNSNTSISKLTLGTAQFGMAYGIANKSGQVDVNEVTKILDLASASGISTLDTAIAYGESESVLGSQPLKKFSIFTKLPEMTETNIDVVEWVNSHVKNSLMRLRISALDGLLLHRPEQLLERNGNKLYDQMLALKDKGVINNIGISIYQPEELNILSKHFHFDLIQAPYNILDRRMLLSGWLERLNNMGIAFHARSIFMQGLLLLKEGNRPDKFSPWNALWKQWDDWLNETEQTPVEACLSFVLAEKNIEKVLIGVDSYEHLQQIIEAADASTFSLPANLQTNDQQLLNPSRWSEL